MRRTKAKVRLPLGVTSEQTDNHRQIVRNHEIVDARTNYGFERGLDECGEPLVGKENLSLLAQRQHATGHPFQDHAVQFTGPIGRRTDSNGLIRFFAAYRFFRLEKARQQILYPLTQRHAASPRASAPMDPIALNNSSGPGFSRAAHRHFKKSFRSLQSVAKATRSI